MVASDPYYPLDCREDDFASCNASPDAQLIPSVEFERLREGIDDSRRLVTLAPLTEQNPGAPGARDGRDLIAVRMAASKLGQRDHDALFPPDDWSKSRHQVDNLIDALQK